MDILEREKELQYRKRGKTLHNICHKTSFTEIKVIPYMMIWYTWDVWRVILSYITHYYVTYVNTLKESTLWYTMAKCVIRGAPKCHYKQKNTIKIFYSIFVRGIFLYIILRLYWQLIAKIFKKCWKKIFFSGMHV